LAVAAQVELAVLVLLDKTQFLILQLLAHLLVVLLPLVAGMALLT
jgi:hypothetical protein